MPDGSLPPRELRFTMTVDNGRIETYFTDSKGKFLLTRLLGLRPDSEYRVTVVSDGISYDTTSVTFKEYGVYYIPIYLRALKAPATKPAGVVDLAELEVNVPEQARLAYSAAMRAYAAEQTDEAVRELRRALTIHPDYFRALNDLGVILLKRGELDEAAKLFERASQIAPRAYHPKLNLALINSRRGRYKEAISSLEQLCKEAPALSDVRIALADALTASNRLDEVEKHLRAALDDPKLPRETAGDLHYKLGLLFNRKQQFDLAVKELEQAKKVLPDSPRTRLQLGAALLQIGKLEEAERELLAAYKIGGAQMGGAQLMLGEIYFRQKKYPDAQRCFEQYLMDVPAAPNAAEVRGVIERIKTARNEK
jgi:superkiller protein 3